MKILFITSSSINGGAQKHIREMYKSLTGLGHKVYLVAPAGWLTDELKEYGTKIISMKLGIKSISKLKDTFEKIEPDITNTFILSGGVYGTMAWKKKKNGKIFITVNNPVIYPGISRVGKMIYPYMYRYMSHYASAFLVKADRVRDEVAEIIRNKKPVISIKNGIDLSVFNKDIEYPEIRNELGIKKDDIVITNVAALDVRKGQEYLIHATEELRKKYPIHVLLVGEGNNGEKLKRLVKEKGAEDYIHFLGRRSDVNCILANSDIFVLPSLHEGLPNALLEAMAMGLPCIATDVGGVRQLIDGDDKGMVIKVRSVEDIKFAVIKIIVDSTYAMKIGNAAYKKINISFSQQNVATELESIYNST